MKDWFIDWFNSPYYHKLYKSRDVMEAEQFVDRLMAELRLPKGSKVLDLGCGKGRHAQYLHKLGYNVVGVDLAEESIEQAKTIQRHGLEFYVHDMRHLYWDAHFDLVVNLFTSFGYFHSADDDLKTIMSVADALVSSGLFVLDYMNVVKVIDNLVSEEQKTIDGTVFRISREVKEGIIWKHIHVIDGDTELDFTEEVDVLGLSDFSGYLQQAGLNLVRTFGSYQLDDFEEASSDRLILLAKKIEV